MQEELMESRLDVSLECAETIQSGQMNKRFNDETERTLKRLKILQEENEKLSLKCTQLHNINAQLTEDNQHLKKELIEKDNKFFQLNKNMENEAEKMHMIR
ncbi:PREDICTED: uncharacterized protein LOC108782922 isoform X2 [Cyphomyrmex costatus]|uniref:uncharacterized protein LOC108782922 isoform X2 n=1 Tax=Cyphomyrmex costatus TaxID=456900 RepID=UPI000852423A|nr:PREDICTED: uncharacterized protein LOC108782922 isoform X2 [Cyphomyrmex costatus]